MAVFVWDPRKFDVGIDTFNDEHRHMVEQMNELFEFNKSNARKDVILTQLAELGRIIKAHFVHEEKFMRDIGFHGLDTHERVHRDLLKEFGAHVEKFKAGPGTIDPGFFSFLKLWLAAHIQHTDKAYAVHAGGLRKTG